MIYIIKFIFMFGLEWTKDDLFYALQVIHNSP